MRADQAALGVIQLLQLGVQLFLGKHLTTLIAERARLQAQILGNDVATVVVQAGLFVQTQLVRRLQATAVVIDISGIDVQPGIAGNLALVVQLAAYLQAAGRVLAQRQNLAFVRIVDAGRRQLQVLAGLDQARAILELANGQLELTITAQQAVVMQRGTRGQVQLLRADQAAFGVVQLL